MDRNRRGFFAKILQQKHNNRNIAMLPYAKNIKIFEQNCIECETKDCVSMCDENIIFLDKNGIPLIDLNRSGCTFCDKCLLSCNKDFLDSNLKSIFADIVLDTNSCLSHNQTMCFSCKDICMANAIKFNGLFNPTIEENICTKCGFCINVCPVASIEIRSKW